MDPHGLSEAERRQMEQIRELDLEELQIEEVDDDFHPSSDEDERLLTRGANDGAAGLQGGFTFNTCLASLHTYLGEVEDTHGRIAFLDGGAILNLPMFYLEGVVLFPEAILPLRVIQPRFIVAVEKALQQVNAPCIIGVVQVQWYNDDGRTHFAATGTSAEIRQFKQLDDGSLNVVTRGQQRFRLRRRWTDVDGAPMAEVQIIQEDTPLRTPRDAFGQLASVNNSRKISSSAKQLNYEEAENSLECMSGENTDSDHSDTCMRTCTSSSSSPNQYRKTYETSSSDEELILERSQKFDNSDKHRDQKTRKTDKLDFDSIKSSPPSNLRRDRHTIKHAKIMKGAPVAFWPWWVYKMYDSYALASRAADLWQQIIGSPKLDGYTNKPDILSFYIASKLPVSESRRQELLEIDGISYRLQREIQLLKSFNLIRCKLCQSLIAKRSDMVVMSSDGPLNAYVNPHGFVHEVITVYNATGLALQGFPCKEHSWFPGYAWTITNCATCESNMGWLFTATKKNLLPRSFWGIRSSQVTDDTSILDKELK